MKSVSSRPNPALKAKSLRPEVPVAGIGGPSLRLLTLLEWIGESDKPQTLSQIVAKLDEPKATVHRLLIGLEEMNYVQRLPGGRHYAPGPRLHHLAIKTLQHGHVSAVRHAILGRLVSEFNESCNLTILDGSEVIYLDRVEADWPLRMDLKPGARVPAYCSASGKMILALMDRSIREPLLRAIRYQAYTPQTITSPGVLETELDRIAARGYSIDQEEYTAGLNCLSVPVLDQAGKCLAAIAVHAPVARLTINTAVKKLDVMRDAAREIAGTLETINQTEKDHAR